MPEQYQTLLGIDYGLARIGLAVGNTASSSAEPLATLQAKCGKPDWQELSNYINDWSVTAFVLGLPLTANGANQDITFITRKFAGILSARYNLPVHLVDERYTSKSAQDIFRSFSKQKQQRLGLDAVAAQLILEQWLNDNF